jgi:hypothetical protein
MFSNIINNQVAVVIPIYKAEMNEFEQISFNQCLKILGNYPIIIVKPTSLSLPEIAQKHLNIQFKDFSDHYFKDIAGYNQLLISTDFYQSFLPFEYILIHQLDVFVFADNLKEWCNKGYDYIGSPYIDPERWTVGGKNPGNYFKKRRIVLNGGFSLRKVKSCIRFLKIFALFGQKWMGNEDGLFSTHFVRLLPFRPFLRLPNWQEALDFGMEQHPQLCYELNHKKLPFGCHAWEKYDYEFWKAFM